MPSSARCRLPSTAKPAAAIREAEAMRQPPRCPPHHPPRDGSCNLAEEHSVPDGKAKSKQAPIRRPPPRAEGHCTGARPSGLFFWTVHGPFSFQQDGKENGGCIPLDKPPAGADTPWPPFGGPSNLYSLEIQSPSGQTQSGVHHPMAPCFTWNTFPPSIWGSRSSSQQVMNTCPPAMRFRTNSCRRGSSSLKTSSSSRTGYSPVAFW